MSGWQNWHLTQLLVCMNLPMIMMRYNLWETPTSMTRDCKTLASDLNNLPEWVDEYKSRLLTKSGLIMDIWEVPWVSWTSNSRKHLASSGVTSSTSRCTDRTTSNSFYSIFLEQQEQATTSSSTLWRYLLGKSFDETDSYKQLHHPSLLHTSSMERHYTVSSVCLLARENVCQCMVRGWKACMTHSAMLAYSSYMRRAWSVRKYSPWSAVAFRNHAHTTRTRHMEIYRSSSWGISSSCNQSAVSDIQGKCC